MYNTDWAWILSGRDANERHVSMDWGTRCGVGRILLDLSAYQPFETLSLSMLVDQGVQEWPGSVPSAARSNAVPQLCMWLHWVHTDGGQGLEGNGVSDMSGHGEWSDQHLGGSSRW